MYKITIWHRHYNILSFISVTIWYHAIIIKVSEEDFKKHND